MESPSFGRNSKIGNYGAPLATFGLLFLGRRLASGFRPLASRLRFPLWVCSSLNGMGGSKKQGSFARNYGLKYCYFNGCPKAAGRACWQESCKSGVGLTSRDDGAGNEVTCEEEGARGRFRTLLRCLPAYAQEGSLGCVTPRRSPRTPMPATAGNQGRVPHGEPISGSHLAADGSPPLFPP